MKPEVVLITGCSTGIGRDCAELLTRENYTVVATARNTVDLDGLNADMKLHLDVTDHESITCAVSAVLKKYGRIDVLVNNAGHAVRGAVEDLTDELMYGIYDVNIFGVVRMIRAVAPCMRKQGSGYIINISSYFGKVTIPANSCYSSTKYALESISDALRIEMIPFGIKVIVIEPGPIRTEFLNNSKNYSDSLINNRNSPYFPLYERLMKRFANMRSSGPGADAVSRVILKALKDKKPKARYLASVPMAYRVMNKTGDRFRDFLLKRLFYGAL